MVVQLWPKSRATPKTIQTAYIIIDAPFIVFTFKRYHCLQQNDAYSKVNVFSREALEATFLSHHGDWIKVNLHTLRLFTSLLFFVIPPCPL